ncbi:MAG: hypothetical protein ACXU87_18665 [Xanthobacteraceae bacterium]
MGRHFLVIGLLAPVYTNGVRGEVASTGTRVVAAVMIALLIGAVLVVLARVGLWQQAFVSDRVIRFSPRRSSCSKPAAAHLHEPWAT